MMLLDPVMKIAADTSGTWGVDYIKTTYVPTPLQPISWHMYGWRQHIHTAIDGIMAGFPS